MLIKRVAYTTLLFIFLLGFAFACGTNTHAKEEFKYNDALLRDSINTLDLSLQRFGNDTALLQTELKKSIIEDSTIRQLVLLKKMGEIHLKNYHFDSAISNHQEYLKLAETLNEPLLMLKALNLLAFDYKKSCSMDDAVTYFFKALKLSGNLEETDRSVLNEKAFALHGMGSMYAMLGYPDEALSYYGESYGYGEILEDKRNWADNRLGIGQAYQEKGLYDSARINYNRAIDLNIEINSRSGIALTLLNLGSLTSKQGNYKEALIYLNSAYETLRNTSDKSNWMEICFTLGDTYTKLADYEAAEKYLFEGLEIGKEIDLPYYLQNAYLQLSNLYSAQNKPELATKYHVLQHTYADLMNRNQAATHLLNAQIEYEKERNNKQISGLKTEYNSKNYRQRIIIVTSLAIIFILIVLFIVYSYLTHLKKQKNRSLVELEKMKSDFYMKITHEFRTPITIIIGLAEKLQNSISNGQSTRNLIDLDIISRQSENLLFLVNEILSVSNLRSQSKIHWINDNIVTYLNYLHCSFSDFAQAKKINYIFHSAPDEIYMDYSKEQIRLIVNNLLSNSIKHCSEGSKIMLLVREEKKQRKCIIEVLDSGVGIQEKDLPHIFETFYQGETDNLKFSGTGIGLAFTKQLVESLGGTIRARSIPFKETVFTVELPIRNYYRKTEDQPLEKLSYSPNGTKSEVEKTGNADDSRKPFVLIAEDNRDMVFYLSSLLRDDFNLVVANDGQEAVDIANEKIPDLIISDLMMPKLDGNQLCRQIKGSVMTSHIPIIILTAKTMTSDRIETIEAGADAFLTKPFIEEELKAKINQLLKSRKELREKYSQVILEPNNNGHNLKKDSDFEFLQKVTDITYREMRNNEFFPQGLADEMHVSVTQLNRKIKSIAGLSSTNYVLMVRLNKAKKLLLVSQKPIGDIATDCGFNDFAYFSKAFKKEFGITPSKFQRMSLEINV